MYFICTHEWEYKMIKWEITEWEKSERYVIDMIRKMAVSKYE